MSNGISSALEDENCRKRTSNTPPKSTPKKKTKFGGFGSAFLNPFKSFVGMFGNYHEEGKNEVENRERIQRVFEVEEEEEEDDDSSVEFLKEEKDILSVEVRQNLSRTPEKKIQIVYLNEENQRIPCGKDAKTNAEGEGSESSSNSDIQEIPSTSSTSTSTLKHEIPQEDDDIVFEKSFEIQQDVEVIGEIEKKKKERVPSNSEMARRLQNEIVFLDEKEQQQEDDDEVSIISDSIFNGLSPSIVNPDDSASRSNTPNLLTPGQIGSSSKNVRDYWRRGQKSITTPNSQKKIPRRVVQNGNIMSISRVSPAMISKKPRSSQKTPNRLSLTKYLEELRKVGVLMDDKNVSNISSSSSSSTFRQPNSKSAELIAKARQRIRQIQDSSREGTPSSTSDRYYAGAQTPSSSSVASDMSSSETKLSEMMRNVNLLSKRRNDSESYAETFNSAQERSDKLNEEIRVRGLTRQTTREDRQQEVRDRLALKGIVLKEKKQPKNEFIELPLEAIDLCKSAWNKRLPENEEFSQDFSLKICRKDLQTFSGLSWLNDEVINFYLQLVCQRSQLDSKYPKSYAFNTFFYANITTKGFASVKRWTRKVDIFSFDVLLIPVHLQYHWCMSVIDLQQKRIDYYDSLGGRNQQCLTALKSYLMEESMDKKKHAFDFDGWSFNLLNDIPRQENGSDCGVFSCQFAEFASRRTPPIFTQQHMPYYRKRMVYEICTKKLLSTI